MQTLLSMFHPLNWNKMTLRGQSFYRKRRHCLTSHTLTHCDDLCINQPVVLVSHSTNQLPIGREA